MKEEQSLEVAKEQMREEFERILEGLIRRGECGQAELSRCKTANKEWLEALKQMVPIVEDFMPNIGKCVLQDYGRLNEGLIKSRELITKYGEKA